jgi:hypothetical protein
LTFLTAQPAEKQAISGDSPKIIAITGLTIYNKRENSPSCRADISYKGESTTNEYGTALAPGLRVCLSYFFQFMTHCALLATLPIFVIDTLKQVVKKQGLVMTVFK